MREAAERDWRREDRGRGAKRNPLPLHSEAEGPGRLQRPGRSWEEIYPGWGNRSRGKRFLPTSPLWDVVTFSQFLGLGLPQPSFLRCFCLPGSHAPVSEASAFRNRESSEPDPSLLPPFLFLPAPIPFFLNFVYLFIVIRNLSVQRLIGLDLCLRDALVTSSYYNWGTKTTGRPGSPPLGRRAAARMN